MHEVFTGGLMPYGKKRNHDVVDEVLKGKRLEKPMRCPPPTYELMKKCWNRVSKNEK